MDVSQIVIMACVGLCLVVWIVLFVSTIGVARIWLQAYLSGTPITFVSLIGMKLRKSDMKKIVEQCIVSTQAGFPISCADMERAWLQKVDIVKVTTAYITARRREQDFSFPELVTAELEGTSQDKFQR
jgi:uncharacterized protein YqfA (UPF0365 family)